jgi:serine/threonine protein kinase
VSLFKIDVLQVDPSKRCTATQALSHDWLLEIPTTSSTLDKTKVSNFSGFLLFVVSHTLFVCLFCLFVAIQELLQAFNARRKLKAGIAGVMAMNRLMKFK